MKTLQELLSGFESRMRVVGIVQAILDRTGTNQEIRKQFANENELDNLIIMVLVYIMDNTLRYDEKCSMENISSFIAEMLPYFHTSINDSDILSKYIIREVLQNSGKPGFYKVFDSNKNCMDDIPIRLIFEEKGYYQLTDDAYNFLFRTKEIDSEMDFSVERFKLSEFIKRGNYTKALNQSSELVKRVRELKLRMDIFLLRCKENISKITITEYEDVMKSVSILLNNEYEELDNIRKVALEKREKVSKALENGIKDEKAAKTENEITEIIRNIGLCIDEQRRLINKKHNLSEIYRQTLEDSFNSRYYKRFDFMETIIKPMEKINDHCLNLLWKLFIPLYKPSLNSFFNIGSYYLRQQKLKEKEDNVEFIITDTEDLQDKKANIRNERFVNIISTLFEFLQTNKNTNISDFLESLDKTYLMNLCEENSLLNVILKLYQFGEINITGWHENKPDIIPPYGEFDLSYCLDNIDPNLLNINKLIIHKVDDETCKIYIGNEDKLPQVEISNFSIDVEV